MVEVQEEHTQLQGEQNEHESGAAVERRLDLPAPTVDDKVVQGKDGWLFLAKDTNDTLGQHAGKRLLTDVQIQQWHDLLEARSAWLSVQGIPYFFLIVPDPHAIYADMLPEEVVPGKTRPVLQLLEHLEERQSWAPVLYPLSALVAERDGMVYPKTDTHWSEYGAYVASRDLMARVTESLPVRRLAHGEVHLSHDERTGDLGVKLDPPVRSRFVYVDVINPRSRVVHDNRVRNHGRLVEYQADSHNALTCLVFGDSYAVRIMPVLAESFQRTFFAHTYYDYELVRELQPDVVVSVVSERTLIKVQSDTGPGIRQMEAEKRAAGDVMPPRKTDSLRIFGMRPSSVPQ